MLPANFRMACRDVPEIGNAFRNRFGGSDPCSAGSDQDAGKVIQTPRLAFLTGAWWIDQGARKNLGQVCNNVRGGEFSDRVVPR
jgi:hypothetical protein